MSKALVLGGGGARGAYQVGMLDVLVNALKLDFQIIRGVSIGALNAAFLAQAPINPNSLQNLQSSVTELLEIWTDEILGNKSVYRERIGGFPALAIGADSLLDNEPLQALINHHLNTAQVATSGRDFAVGVVNLVDGSFSERNPSSPTFLDEVLASAAIPVIFPPVWNKSAQEVLVDGGVREITPLSSVFRAAPTEIYVLMGNRAIKSQDGSLPRNTSFPSSYTRWDDNFIGTRVTGLDILKRTIEILNDEIYLDDIRGAVAWNNILRSVDNFFDATSKTQLSEVVESARSELESNLARIGKKHVPIHVIAPQEWYGEANSGLAFDPSMIRRAIDHGREVASDRSKWLWSDEVDT